MINLITTALIAFTGGAVEYADNYIAPFELSLVSTYDFNTIVTNSSARYTQTFLDSLVLNGSLTIPKQSTHGIYLYTLNLQGYQLQVMDTSMIYSTPHLINSSSGALNLSIGVDSLSSIYHSLRTTGTTLRWDYTLWSNALDDNILYVPNCANISFTSGLSPVNKFMFDIDTDVIYNKITLFARQYVNNDYSNGYLDGYDDGKIFQRTEDVKNIGQLEENAYNDGFDDGRAYGYNQGVQDGSNKGITLQKLFWSVIDEPFAVIYRLLDFDVLGVNLFAFISGLVTLGIIGFIIKMII